MALSASCPGMVFPQLAMGVPSAPVTLAGASAGGILWSAVLRPRLAARMRHRPAAKNYQQQQQHQPPRTLADLTGAGRTAMLLVYTAALAAAVAAAAAMAPSAPSALHPVAGGLAIGAAQLVSLLLRGSPLGVSACYEHVGDWVVYCLSSRREGSEEGGGGRARPPVSSLVFSGAMMVGARLLVWVRPEWTLVSPAAVMVAVSPVRAFAGGLLMAVGSRVGGGCTSGHGISGMGLMSVSSFVSMFAAFAAAIAVTQLRA